MSNKTPKWVYNGFLIGFSIVVILYIGVVSYNIISGKVGISDYFILYGDSFAAFFTALSIVLILYQIRGAESDRDRILLEAEKDRKLTLDIFQRQEKIDRLKVSLGYYVKIINLFDEYSSPGYFQAAHTNLKTLMNHDWIREEYWMYLDQADSDYIKKYYDDEKENDLDIYKHRGNAEEYHSTLLTQFRDNQKELHGKFLSLLE